MTNVLRTIVKIIKALRVKQWSRCGYAMIHMHVTLSKDVNDIYMILKELNQYFWNVFQPKV